MKRPDGLQWKKVFILTGIGAALAAVVSVVRGIFSVDDLQTVFRFLSDGALVAAVAVGGIGLVAWLSGEGTFDAGSYVFGRTRNIFAKKKSEKRESFYEYKQRRAQKKGLKPVCFLIAGAVWLVLSFVFLGIYYLA